MRRREFIAGVAAAAMVPSALRAQRATTPVIGFLTPVPRRGTALETDAFVRGLADMGYVEGRNLDIEYRFLDGFAEMPSVAAELVRRPVVAIFAVSPPAVLAIKAQTTTIPVVFSIGEDPVKEGLVTNLNRPGGNITGYSNFQNVLGSKKISLLGDLAAKPARLGMLVNPTNPNAEPDAKDAQSAARALGRDLQVFPARTEDDLVAAFAEMSRLRIGGLLVNIDRLFLAERERVVALAARYAIPVLYERRQFVMSGGLMSYGASEAEGFHQCGVYMGRILNGANPGDLPVQQPTRLELVVNLKTAKALGLSVPETLLAIADEVVQ
jgi:putative tryptophan/tyrosine transport system substrate-binding protein